MVMCGLIHASILKMGRAYVTEEEEAEFIHRCRDFALRRARTLTAVSHSPSSVSKTLRDRRREAQVSV